MPDIRCRGVNHPICLDDDTVFIDITKSVVIPFRFNSFHKSAIDDIHLDLAFDDDMEQCFHFAVM